MFRLFVYSLNFFVLSKVACSLYYNFILSFRAFLRQESKRTSVAVRKPICLIVVRPSIVPSSC